ncbi:MAG: c-type cytochrome [Anaerolineales bacterium]|jgi:mono/diheme cytochrome c family protein
MRKALKIVGIAAGVLVAVGVIAFIAVYASTESRLNKTYSVDPGSIVISSEPKIIAEGQRLATIRGCTDCHGADLGGDLLLADPAIGTIYATNLTAGEGGVGQYYTNTDYLRAIRNGIDAEGHGLVVMPSVEYNVLSDEDVGALIAYINSLSPVDRVQPEPSFGPLGRILIAMGQLPPLAAEIIDHDAPRPAAPEALANAEFGAYMATSCMGCHGTDFSGGAVPGSPPDAPQAANLTPAGDLGNWTQAEFINTMHTGLTPEGKTLDPSVMPWPISNAMTDVELEALWMYLSSLEPVE